MTKTSWPIAPIKSVCTLNPRRPLLDVPPDQPTSFVPMASVCEVTGTVADIKTRPFAEVVKGYTYFEEGDVIFAKITPCMQNGKHAIVKGLHDGFGFGSTEFHVLRPSEKVIPDWLHFFVRQPRFLNDAMKAFSGAVGQQRVPESFIADSEIPLPPVPTQRRIASRLKQQMAAIDEMRQAVKDQEDAVTPLFERTLAEAFQGITPLSLGIGADAAPAGWQWRRLLDLARLESGHTPSRRHPEYWENGDIPWLALPDIRALDCLVANDTSEHTNKLGIANSSARILPKDTVALSRTASVGFVTRFGRPMATSQDFVNWICGTEIDPAFLMWLLRASRKFIRSVSTGAIHQTVYVDVVNRFEVCHPNLTIQRAIAARMDECFTHVENLRRTLAEQSEAISALPGAYLGEAFGSAMD